MKETGLYSVKEIIESIPDTETKELSKNVEMLTDEIEKLNKKLKVVKLTKNIAGVLGGGGILMFGGAVEPALKLVGAGAFLIGATGFLISKKLYKKYSKDLEALGFVSTSIVKELYLRVRNEKEPEKEIFKHIVNKEKEKRTNEYTKIFEGELISDF